MVNAEVFVNEKNGISDKESEDNGMSEKQPHYTIKYLDRQDPGNDVFEIEVDTLVGLEQMRELHGKNTKTLADKDERDKNFMGVVISAKVMPLKKPTSAFQGGGEQHRAADRILMVSDVLHDAGHCAAIIFQDANDSRKGFDHLLQSEVLVGLRILLMNVSFKDDFQCLHNDRDVPILLADDIYPCQNLSTQWALMRSIPFNPPKELSVTRAVTFKNFCLRANNVRIVRANCNARFCDRSMCFASTNDAEVKCVCLSPKGYLGGSLVLSMNIQLYNEKEYDDGVTQNERYDMIFHPYQSLQWSKFLLGKSIETTNSTVDEWQRGILNIRKHIDEKIERINKEGGWDVFAWYKNGLVENKVEIVADPNGAKSTGNSGGFGTRRTAEKKGGKYGAMAVKPHIVRILPRQNQDWWMTEGKEMEYVFEEDGMGKKRKASIDSAADKVINMKPF